MQDDPQDRLHPQNDDSLDDDLQNLPQEDPKSNNALILFDPLHGQNPKSHFEHFLSFGYTVQQPMLSNLNRLDFKNLLLAGARVPVSQELQMKIIIPSKCNEILVMMGIPATTCSKTTETVKEIKACHGVHHDGWGVRGRREMWIEPRRLLKHVHESNSLVQASSESEGGHFDSFNVCIDCHERDRQRRRPFEDSTISTFHTALCQIHCLKYRDKQPYNVCQCLMFLEKYWRCNVCSLDTLDELRLRAQTFGEFLWPTFKFDEAQNQYIDVVTGTTRRREKCPIVFCTRPAWTNGPIDQQMMKCGACTAIFPHA